MHSCATIHWRNLLSQLPFRSSCHGDPIMNRLSNHCQLQACTISPAKSSLSATTHTVMRQYRVENAPAAVFQGGLHGCRGALTSGATPWRECIKSLTRINESCLSPHTIRLVIAIVAPSAPPSVTVDEFTSVTTRDLSLDARHVLQLDTSPTDAQVCPTL